MPGYPTPADRRFRFRRGGFVTVQLRLVAAIGVLLLGVGWGSAPAGAQDAGGQNPRIALVVGEAAYPDHPLATTANDAGLVAQTLQAAGFDVVGARDLDQNGLRGALRDFLDKAAALGPDMEAFVYLAGRGVQYDGDNYFLPVDARIARDADIPLVAVRIADFARALAATPGRAQVIVLDAAREAAPAAAGSSLAGGLGLVDPEDGALMAFNAAPGTVAPDEPGPYGVYGKTLAGALREGGVPIDEVFAQTRLAVSRQTGGAVIPWSVSRIAGPYSIFERAADAPPPAAVAAATPLAGRPLKSLDPDAAYSVALERDTLDGYREFLAAFPDSPLARRMRAILAARREASFWRRAVDENSPRAFWTYLRLYPRGAHSGDARRRLAMLAAPVAPPPDFAPLDYDDLPPPPPDERRYGEGPAFVFDDPDYGAPPPPPAAFLPEPDERWRDLPPPPPPEGHGFLPALAIPLLLGAEVYRHHRRDGAADAQQPGPGAPPPLPAGVRPHAPAPGGPAPAAGGAARPLPSAPGVHAPGAAVAPPGASKPAPAAPPPAVANPAAAVPVNPAAEPAAPISKPSRQEPKTEPPRPAAAPVAPQPPPVAAPTPQPKAPPQELKTEPPRPAAAPLAPRPPPAAAPPPPVAAPPPAPAKTAPQELKTEPPRPAAAPLAPRPPPAAAPPPPVAAPPQAKAPAQEPKVEPPRPAAAPVAPKPPPAAAPPPQAKAPPQPAPARPSRPACGAANEPPCPK
jgi:uncharacterized caspase-like protein